MQENEDRAHRETGADWVNQDARSGAPICGPVRYGMIGGGSGAFIGGVHRTAAAIAGNWQLVAGALSSTPDKARASGADIGLPDDRAYGSWMEMLERELLLPPHLRMEAVAIVTPNNVHAAPAIAAMEAGFDVIIDKPLADSLNAAHAISQAASRTGRRIAITHTYTGYGMVKQARDLIASGRFGKVRRVAVKYTQDWLSRAADLDNNKQAAWRVDPSQAGDAGAFGDIGTHAANLVEYVTGERITRLCAELTMLPGRRIDDDGAALFHLSGGGKGTLIASQVLVGDSNDLAISIYCDEAGLHWRQEEPTTLRVGYRDRPTEIWHAGAGRAYLSPATLAVQRTPGGHPEGYLEAFANIYRAFGEHVRGRRADGEPGFATIADALRGMEFLRASLESSRRGGSWVELVEDMSGEQR
ncbi:Gfo/Idh/MocA family oxidoreductase [Sphingobium sp. HBC34]|uniref:Gfo/Idh/MocA family oxidoreductase n=1 Tax=Sphingobium cyanobacteriorum TaxID=3063954 RepID=A0ABT8ZQ11_9SPHN|nr:Gfo/Idh/MocA family oxidoreductase [Sphingobium sp. HBC34]MDO7836629.1 Gfo/Idh/MocA family oxidoreductase [Sphingobium sp. HBC34]